METSAPTYRREFKETSPDTNRRSPMETSAPTYRREFNETSPETKRRSPIETSAPTYKREFNETSPLTNRRSPKDTSAPTYKRCDNEASFNKNNLPLTERSSAIAVVYSTVVIVYWVLYCITVRFPFIVKSLST